MIITHTINPDGRRRLYLGAKGSLECWLEPRQVDSAGMPDWSFHLEEAFTGNRLTDADKREWAVYMLAALAAELDVPPDDLAAVPFEAIAALHAGSPFENRRMPTSKRAPVNGYQAAKPGISRPAVGSGSHDREWQRTRA